MLLTRALHAGHEFRNRLSPSKSQFSGGNLGVYATVLNGPFFADALFKADFLDLTFSDPVLGRAKGDARTTRAHRPRLPAQYAGRLVRRADRHDRAWAHRPA